MYHIPILWRYLLGGYLRIFALSVASFIALLLVARFKEIARFAALSDESATIVQFVLYQIPLILPIAIPFSALIAAFLLAQSLSRSYEITALRISGVNFASVLSPLLLAGLFFSFINLSLTAEIFPACRRASKTIFYEKTSSNPLLLLQRQHLVKVKRSYLTLDPLSEDKEAKNVLFIVPNPSTHRLMLIAAERLTLDEAELKGKGLSFISYLPGDKEGFDPLMIENQVSMTTDARALSALLKKRRPSFDVGSLGLSMLREKGRESSKYAKRAKIELYRRLSLALTPLTFTWAGFAFGVEMGRNPSRKNLLFLLVCILLVLTGYFLGKELKVHCNAALLILFLPQLLAWGASARRLQSLTKGRS